MSAPTAPLPADLVADEGRQALWNYAAFLANKGLQLGLGFAVVALLTRSLGPAGYGTYSLILAAYGLVAQLLLSWPDQGVLRLGREEVLRRGSLHETLGARLLLFGVPAGLLVVAYVGAPAGLIDRLDLPAGSGPTLLLFVVGATLSETMVYALIAAGRLRWAGTVPTLRLGLTLGVIAAVTGGRPASVAQVLLLLAIGQLGAVAAGLPALLPLLRPGRTGLRPVLGQARRLLAYAWPLAASGLASYLFTYGDLFVIKLFLPHAEVGRYAVAYQLMNYANGVIASIGYVLVPLMVSLRTMERSDLISAFAAQLAPAGLYALNLLLGLGILGADRLLALAVGGEYAAAGPSILVLLAAVGINGVYALYANILTAFDRTKQISAYTLILAGSNVALDLVLVPRLGIVGAALATAIALAGFNALAVREASRLAGWKDGMAGMLVMLLCFPAVGAMIIGLATPSLLTRALLYWSLVTAGTWAIRWAGAFRRGDLSLLDRVEMPRIGRRILHAFVGLLAHA